MPGRVIVADVEDAEDAEDVEDVLGYWRYQGLQMVSAEEIREAGCGDDSDGDSGAAGQGMRVVPVLARATHPLYAIMVARRAASWKLRTCSGRCVRRNLTARSGPVSIESGASSA